MALAFDAVGPSSAGAFTAGTGPLTWAQTCSGSSRLLLAQATVDVVTWSSGVVSATYAGAAMTFVTAWQSGGAGKAAGYTALFKLINPATGTNNVVITSSSGSPITGGSISFTGADQVTGIGTAHTADPAGVNATTASITLTGTTAGNIVVAVMCNGSGTSSATAGTSRWISNHGGGGAAGDSAGASIAAGGSVTITWAINSDWYAIIGVEVLAAATGTSANAGAVTAAASAPAPTALLGGIRPGAATATATAPAPAAQIGLHAQAGLAAATATAPAPHLVKFITGLGGTGAGYFVDQSGAPRLVVGDAAWGLSMNAGRWNSGNYQATFDAYFAARGAQGYTVCYFTPLGSTHNGGLHDGGNDWNNDSPWVGGDPGTLNNTFWARIDYMIASAASNGITLFLNAVGYETDMETGGALGGKTSTQYQNYGAALAARYAATPNLVWMVADDYFGGFDTQIAAFLTGLRSGGDTHVIAIENYAESTSRQDLSDSSALPWGTSHTQFNFVYTYNVTYVGVEHAHLESSPVTPVWGDGYFYQNQATSAEELLVRSLAWWALTSGGRGYIVGDERIWTWPTTAAADVTVGTWPTAAAGNIRTAFEKIPGWHLLIPDTSSALVTSGRGTHATSFTSGGGGGEYEAATDAYVTASRVPDGSLAVIFMSHASTIGIDQTKMGAGYTATWLDPASGATTPGTAGSSYNSGSQGSNSAGGPDWVLVLQAPVATSASAGSAAGTGSAGAPRAGLGALAGSAAAAGSAGQPAAHLGPSAGAAAAAGSAPAPAAGVGGRPGSAAAAGSAPAPAAAIGPTAGMPTAAGTAGSTLAGVGARAAAATSAGTAPAPGVALTVSAGLPSAVGTAPAPSVAGAGTGQPATATAVATAPSPSVAITATAGAALAAAAGPPPLAGAGVLAAAATAAAMAPAPSAAVSSPGTGSAGPATATATAGQPAVAIGVSAGAAAAAGAAGQPAPGIGASPGSAAAVATAPQPSAELGHPQGVGNAGAAVATGLAGMPTVTGPVGGIPVRLRIGAPRSAWSAGEPRAGWSAGEPHAV
jgi:hypothetical protein